RRYDYACVETAAELRAVERGVTRAGQVKHSATRHEKDDRSRVDDPSRWVLGSSAAPKKAALQAELERLRAEAEAAERARDARDDEQTARQDMLRHLDALRRLDWAAIDQDGARRDLDRVEAQLALLLDAQGELARAQARLERAAAAVADAEGALEKLRDRRSRTSADQEREQARRDAAAGELAALEPVPAAVAAALAARFAATGLGLDQAGRRVRDELAGHALRVDRRVAGVEQKCVVAMSQYKAAWPGPAADLAADIDYLAEFRQILATLRSDRLPEFETRFFDLLQSQSRNNIGLIAKTITSSRRDIRLRVNPINQSLRQTDYAPGRHLSLRVIDAPPPGVVEFLQTLNTIVAGSLDDAAGIEATPAARQLAEERFQSLERLLRRLASPDPADQNWRKLCLDTRQHVKFRADVVDSATDVVDDVYVSAGGLSGGERQKLVVFCLAAALRYQLAREGSPQPSYGLVVLDEAFDKTDPAFTKAGLDVFQAFGFQLVLATPLKMLQTLEDHVGGAVQVVNREGEGSSCETLIWEPAGDAPPAVPVPPEQESLL
ncbi:MAG: hypothetical protein LBS56_07520, partial [Propionibacteriaceae bacterium]|nr:hypothetical protein [Propionibacteriaceae bacterium]